MKFSRNWDGMAQRLQNEATGSGYADADKRMYKVKLAKDGTFNSVIRFLPGPGDELPMVKVFSHQYKDKNGDVKEECPTTLGQQCPICQSNREIWNTDEDTARPRSRNTAGISNILVIQDPQNPANNGKIFLWRFGKRVLDKINEKCFPDDKQIALGKKKIRIFDYYEGANFRLNAKKVIAKNGRPYPDYSLSEFDTPEPLGAGPNHPNGDEELMGSIDKQLYSLKEFTDPSKFKSYEQLRDIFDKARAMPTNPPPAASAAYTAPASPAPAAYTAPASPAPVAPPAQPAVQTEAAHAAPPAPAAAPAAAPVQTTAQPPVQPPPPSAPESSLNFDAVEEQSEDEFWNSIKKGS
jgi:hypothetical protein